MHWLVSVDLLSPSYQQAHSTHEPTVSMPSKKTDLQWAVQHCILPKARRPFALFCQAPLLALIDQLTLQARQLIQLIPITLVSPTLLA